ncbi:Zn-dependent exopeptidase [Testicularia cyperi]|uniref:Zn-dependent exopeptidase n=1 Tax=Testicularia cyperi TaxID=1882483 RepID=A0A317XHN0_9BASI|nr:Zn-dependent exopeptidase [Testicularia cyperi]
MAPLPPLFYEAFDVDSRQTRYHDDYESDAKVPLMIDEKIDAEAQIPVDTTATPAQVHAWPRLGIWIRRIAIVAWICIFYSVLADTEPQRGPHRHHHHGSSSIAHWLRPFRSPCPHAQAVRGYRNSLEATQLLSSPAEVAATFGKDADKPANPEQRWKQWLAKLESDFLAVPSADGARNALQRYTNVSHYAGTETDYNSALQILEEWGQLVGAPLTDNLKELVFDAGSAKSQAYLTGAGDKTGVRAWTDTYSVYLNQPINSSLTLAKPDAEDAPYWTAKLAEDVLEKDPTSGRGVPLFHGYSASGAASGQIVFAGMGRKQDFADLAAKGIDVKGKIVLVDYGGNFRGLKVRAAQEAGAVAVIIYTDTIEDGEITEANGYAAYPDGPARNPSAVQRGSVQGLSFYPGDPGTPGKPSYRNATRIAPEEADSLPKIPSLPLSYSEAKVLFEALKGKGVRAQDVNDRLAGAIDGVEYWTGPSDDIVHLENFVDMKVRDIWNTYAVLPGHVKDEVVILGNHRDAWTFGAADPNSGTAAFHEAIKGLGKLYKAGWRPMRTIVFASWDAEEYGLVGSTEFGEDYAEWIRKHVVAYHNVDVSVSGSQILSNASPSLARLVQDAAARVDDPNAPAGSGKKVQVNAFNPLGSGSDYTVFLQHLGIASTDLGYKRAAKDPIYMYHSNFDSFYWMDTFGDPGFKRHEAAAKIIGLMALDSSMSIFAPLNIGDYADELQKYFGKVQKLALKKLGVQENAPWLRELQRSIHDFRRSAHRLEHHQRQLTHKLVHLAEKMARRHHPHGHGHGHGHGDHPHHGGEGEESQPHRLFKHPHHDRDEKLRRELWKLLGQIRAVNSKLQNVEKGFISPEGLEGRSWYKHLVTAPGRWLGYGATTFPGLTEAITLDNGNGLEKEAARLTKHIHAVARQVIS